MELVELLRAAGSVVLVLWNSVLSAGSDICTAALCLPSLPLEPGLAFGLSWNSCGRGGAGHEYPVSGTSFSSL